MPPVLPPPLAAPKPTAPEGVVGLPEPTEPPVVALLTVLAEPGKDPALFAAAETLDDTDEACDPAVAANVDDEPAVKELLWLLLLLALDEALLAEDCAAEFPLLARESGR